MIVTNRIFFIFYFLLDNLFSKHFQLKGGGGGGGGGWEKGGGGK